MGVTTRMYRRSRILEDELDKNKDLVFYIASHIFCFLSGVALTILAIYVLLKWSVIDQESLSMSVTKVSGAIFTLIAAWYSWIKAAHAPTGAIMTKLQQSGNKPLEQMNSRGYSVMSTYMRGSSDVLFEQQEEKRGCVPETAGQPKA